MTNPAWDQLVCYQCIEDEYLSSTVQNDYEVGECAVCGQDDCEAISIEALGTLIEPIVRQCFQPGEVVHYVDDNDKSYWPQLGDSLSDVIQQILGQYFDFHDEIVAATIDAEDVLPPDGEEPQVSEEINYVEATSGGDGYRHKWTAALEELKYTRRFFSPAARDLFESLFSGIDGLKYGRGRSKKSVVRTLRAGTQIFRARLCPSWKFLTEAYKDPYKHIGPPPREEARAGRMNADGVVVLYAAMDEKTCLAEMRPALASELLVVTLETTKPLRILDFGLLEKARLAGTESSYFHPNYLESKERNAFLEHLHRLISQPVVPGRENEYLITQTMAEYLAHVCPHPIDGIMFESAQRAKGVNIVLFGDREVLNPSDGNAFPAKYLDQSIRLFKTSGISYQHSAEPVDVVNGVPTKRAWLPELDWWEE